MAEQPEELKKPAEIANDLEFVPQLRLKAIEQLGNVGSHDALLALLNLAAKEKLTTKEREFALRQAIKIVRSNR